MYLNSLENGLDSFTLQVRDSTFATNSMSYSRKMGTATFIIDIRTSFAVHEEGTHKAHVRLRLELRHII